MRDFSQDHRWLSINTATVRKSGGQDLPLPADVLRRIPAPLAWPEHVAAFDALFDEMAG